MVQPVVLSPLVRRSVLVAHTACAVGWLGAAAAFLSLAVAGLRTHDGQTVQAAYTAMDIIIRFVLVPTALSGVAAGLILATGTHWGLFRHWWVLLKLLIAVPAALILIGTVGSVSDLAHAHAHAAHTAGPAPTELHAEGTHLLTHAAGGLLVLLVPVALSVFKPFGAAHPSRSAHVSTNPPPPPTHTAGAPTPPAHVKVPQNHETGGDPRSTRRSARWRTPSRPGY